MQKGQYWTWVSPIFTTSCPSMWYGALDSYPAMSRFNTLAPGIMHELRVGSIKTECFPSVSKYPSPFKTFKDDLRAHQDPPTSRAAPPHSADWGSLPRLGGVRDGRHSATQLVVRLSASSAPRPRSPPSRSVPIRLASCAFAVRVGARPRGVVAPGAQARRRRPLPRPEQLLGCSRDSCLDVALPHPNTAL